MAGMNNEDRIFLAEKMGWLRWEHPNRTHLAWTHPDTDKPAALECDLPDPEHDANDDYAVLEWMRKRRDSLLARDADVWRKFMAVIHDMAFCTSLYQIGDYARAALEVLQRENNND